MHVFLLRKYLMSTVTLQHAAEAKYMYMYIYSLNTKIYIHT